MWEPIILSLGCYFRCIKKKPYGHAIKDMEKKAMINMTAIEKGVFFKKKQVRKKALKRLGIETKKEGLVVSEKFVLLCP